MDLTTLGVVRMPYMSLSFSDADPVATCGCGARFVGDSMRDAVVDWVKHVAEKHRDDWGDE